MENALDNEITNNGHMNDLANINNHADSKTADEEDKNEISKNVDSENIENGKFINEPKENNEPIHLLTDSWTFWYVYCMSHSERKKRKK